MSCHHMAISCFLVKTAVYNHSKPWPISKFVFIIIPQLKQQFVCVGISKQQGAYK